MSSFNVNVKNYVLTPLCCAALINEMIKNLMYQKDQIPYPYTWLKSQVERKRQRDISDDAKVQASKPNLTASKHFQTVSKTYDSLETIMRNIAAELQQSELVEEIVLVFGVTPLTPKEVITIKMNKLAYGHSEREHIVENNTKQLKLMRELFLSPNWSSLSDHRIACTNIYVFMKKCGETTLDDNIFIPSNPFLRPPRVKETVININYEFEDSEFCCEKVKVFNEKETNIHEMKNISCDSDQVELTSHWVQSKLLIQGFKDCFINKVSASDLW